MAVSQDKVMVKLNEIFKGKSITEHYKKAIAPQWAAKIETDEDIDKFIEDRKDEVLEASKEADRRATQAVKDLKDETVKKITGEPKDEPKTLEAPEGTPEWMKPFLAELKATREELGNLKATKQAETVESKFRAHTAIKDIPESFYKRAIPSKEEDIEATATEIAKEWGEIQTQYKFSSFGNDKPGANRGAVVKEDAESKPDEAVANFAKAKNDKFIQEQSKN